MATVQIRGRINTTVLAVGQTAEVERTERIDRLVERGYIEIVDDTVIEDVPESGPVREVVGTEPPVSGAGSGIEAWRKFLGDNGFEFSEDASKSELIDLWNGSVAIVGETDE